MFPLGCMLDIRHLSPRRKGPSMAQPIMRGFQQRALNTKEIVDGTVHREKPLGVARRFEPPHLAFLLAGGLMRYLCRLFVRLSLQWATSGKKSRRAAP